MRTLLFRLTLLLAMMSINCFGQSYQLTDLGALIGPNSYAQGINNQGQVVGYWDTTNGAHAFLYQNGTATDLGLLGFGATNNYALSINDLGQVVGFSETTNGSRAFLYQNGVMTNWGNFGSYAFGINGSSKIVGYVDTANGSRAVLYDGGNSIQIGTLGGTNSFGFGINNSMQVVGSSLLTNNLNTHAFLWQNGAITDLNQISMFTGNWQLVDAHGIDDQGDIVGWGMFGNQPHAYLFYNIGLPLDLGVLSGGTNSYALGINNSNQIVGASSSASGNRAVLWQNCVAKDLNNLVSAYGWQLKEACGINDSGQIVGWGMINSQAHAFLLTPYAASPTSSSLGAGQLSGFQPLLLPPGGAGFTVSITSPNNNTIFPAPTNLNISATATDSGGTVTQIQFYAGGMLLGIQTNNPSSVTWTNASIGKHMLLVIAQDDVGQFATSSIVNVSISTNLLPVADSYIRGGTYAGVNYGTSGLLLCWTTGDINNYCITFFKFDMSGLTNIASANLNTYAVLSPAGGIYSDAYAVSSTSWTESGITWNNSPALGSAQTVIAVTSPGWYDYNISGYVKSQPAGQPFSVAIAEPIIYTPYMAIYSKESSLKPYLTVETSNPLSVTITNPLDGATFVANTNIEIDALPAVQDGSIAWVQFFAGTKSLGIVTNAPYSVVWTNVGLGTYPLTAVVGDGVALTATSSVVTITVATNLLPVADAFVRDGAYTNVNYGTNWVLECNVTNSNDRDIYFKFDLTNFKNNLSSAQLNVFGGLDKSGSVKVAAYSVSDTSWGELTLTWSNKPSLGTSLFTNTVPSTNGVWYTYDVSQYVTAQKNGGQNLVSLALHDPTANHASTFLVNSKENSTNQPFLVITSTNAPPSVSLISPTPANNTVFPVSSDISLAATASDDDAVAQVQFFANTTCIGIVTNPPYSLVWSNVSSGIYALTAQAVDNYGLVTVSSPVTNLIVDIPPTVTMTNPADNSVFITGNNLVLGASAADADGTVTQVQFFAGPGAIGSDVTSPYKTTWTNIPSGHFMLTAQATDNYGLTSTSSVINVTMVIDSNGDGIPDYQQVLQGDNPLNPWKAGSNDHTPPIISLVIPTNAIIVP